MDGSTHRRAGLLALALATLLAPWAAADET